MSLFAPAVLASNAGGFQNAPSPCRGQSCSLTVCLEEWLNQSCCGHKKGLNVSGNSVCTPLMLGRSNGTYFNLVHKVIQTPFMLLSSPSLHSKHCTTYAWDQSFLGSKISSQKSSVDFLKWMLSSFLYLVARTRPLPMYVYRLGKGTKNFFSNSIKSKLLQF